MPTFRLDSSAPVLADRFRSATPEKRRKATRVALEGAAAATLEGTEVGGALDVVGLGGSDAALRLVFEEIAARCDDECLRLEEEGAPEVNVPALRLFSKARAASALAFGLSGDESLLHEAIYEALMAMEDPAELSRLVDAALR